MGTFLVWLLWVLAAATCIGSGFAVVTLANPFYSALSLIGNLASLAVLYLLASAEFVAAAQVLVYAGAVMVMFLFVIAYLGGRADAPWASSQAAVRVAAVVTCVVLLAEVVLVIALDARDGLSSAAEITEGFGSPRELGRLFLGDNLLAFEVSSLVLLIGAVGGVILGATVRRGEVEE